MLCRNFTDRAIPKNIISEMVKFSSSSEYVSVEIKLMCHKILAQCYCFLQDDWFLVKANCLLLLENNYVKVTITENLMVRRRGASVFPFLWLSLIHICLCHKNISTYRYCYLCSTINYEFTYVMISL